MELAKYKACICEGSAEEAIIDILVDNDLLIFKREEMLEECVIRCTCTYFFIIKGVIGLTMGYLDLCIRQKNCYPSGVQSREDFREKTSRKDTF